MIELLLLFQILFGVAVFTIFCYIFFELHYFCRSLLCVISAKIKKKIHVLDETNVRGICLTTDIDNLLTHMNNARFLRELDFAKIDFLERSGLLKLVRKHKGSICLGATTIRYRRYIKLFTFYKITSKIIYWDNLSIYMEHKFISSDNFISAIILCRTRITNCDVEVIMNEALEISENGNIENAKREKPELTQVLQKWIEHNNLSSENLRKSIDDKSNDYTKREVNGNTTTKDFIIEKTKTEIIGCTNPTFNDKT